MDNKTQRFKISLPIIKTYVEIHKDKDGNEKEVRFVEGLASGTEKDLHGDRMAPSAIQTMADSLKLHVINLNDEHNTSWQSELGELVELEVTKKDDLRIKAKLNEMSKSNDLWYALTDLNKKLGLSIGGYVKEYEMEKDESGDEPTWVRVYKDIELDHIAVTSRPAYPKAWVSVISKSIEISEADLKEVKKRVPATYNKEQTLKELAHKIVRSIQNMEADLLLELAITGLSFLNEEQLKLVERNLPMNKKDVSLEAEEAQKADAEVQPEDKAETTAKPENESSEDKSEVSEESKDEAEEAEATDAEATEEKSAEKSEDKAEEADASSEEAETDTEETETEKDESEDDSGEEEATDGEEDTEDADAEKSDEDKSEDKSDEAEEGQLLKTVHELSKSLKSMVEANTDLVKRIEELEAQPADRKTIAVKKSVGDDDSEEVDAKALKKERDEKIAELRKTHVNNPALFSMIQRTRSEYASKIQQSE